jgi:hypothetical protein
MVLVEVVVIQAEAQQFMQFLEAGIAFIPKNDSVKLALHQRRTRFAS